MTTPLPSTAPGALPVGLGRRLAGPALAGLLVATGVTHFVAPQFYDALIPKSLPGAPRTWVLASGGVELACAAALANRRSRRIGATLAIVLFLAVFPANIQMAIDWRHDGWLKAAIAFARLPLQVPLIYWAVWVRRQARPTGLPVVDYAELKGD